MSDRTTATRGPHQHQPLTEYLATGGQPADHPAAELLLAVAVCVGTKAQEDLVVAARRRLADPGEEDQSLSLWVLELLGQVGVARWWAAGFDPQSVVTLRDEFPATVDALRRPLMMTVVDREEPFICAVTGRSWLGRAIRLDVRRKPAPPPKFIAAHVIADLLDSWPGETHPCLVEEMPPSSDQDSPLLPVAGSIDMGTGLFELAITESHRPFTCPLTGRIWTGRALALLAPGDLDDITLLAANIVTDLITQYPGITTSATGPCTGSCDPT